MELVKITSGDGGEKRENPVWCVGTHLYQDAMRTLCGGEAYGYGESNAEYETKPIGDHGVTCPRCREFITQIRTIKL